jgi:hypothetical protein
MRYRVSNWAGAGFLIGIFWACAAATMPMTAADPTAWTLAGLTCPIAFASFHFHFPVGIGSALLANTATYAMAGLVVEFLRQQIHYPR